MTSHFDHERPDPERVDEWEYTTDESHSWRGATVLVSKVGGGTIGRAYDGSWHYAYIGTDGSVEAGSDLVTGTPHTHAEAAAEIVAYFEAD